MFGWNEGANPVSVPGLRYSVGLGESETVSWDGVFATLSTGELVSAFITGIAAGDVVKLYQAEVPAILKVGSFRVASITGAKVGTSVVGLVPALRTGTYVGAAT